MTFTSGMAKSKRKFPVTSGLGADDKHEGRQSNLVPTKGSFVPRRLKAGL